MKAVKKNLFKLFDFIWPVLEKARSSNLNTQEKTLRLGKNEEKYLEMTLRIYDQEEKRLESVQNRAGVLLAFTGLIFTLIVTFDPTKPGLSNNLPFLLFVSSAYLIGATWSAIEVMKRDEYQVLGFLDLQSLQSNFLKNLVQKIQKIVVNNSQVINNKVTLMAVAHARIKRALIVLTLLPLTFFDWHINLLADFLQNLFHLLFH
jgi:hypothetical protein